MALTFKRGIHPKEQKQYTEDVPINLLSHGEGSEMVYPMAQHLGVPCEPVVSVGSRVLQGQKIGDSLAFVCAPIHSSVSGTVKDIRRHMTASGNMVKSVIIEDDGKLEQHPDIRPRSGFDDLSREVLLTVIREAGIVGLGGAGFPTHVKLSPPPDKPVDTIIVNGCECEPYLTTDNRVMIEEPDRIVLGLRIMLKIIPGARGVVAVEDNKPEAIRALRPFCAETPGVELAVVKTKYPQGAERQLIYAVTKREVPSGGLPMDAGCIVNNVDTVIAIHRAVFRGRPLMRKVVTLTGGAVKNPGNYKVRLGTKVGDLVEMAGGFCAEAAKVVVGGPMMGVAIFDIDVPVVKTTSGVLFLTSEEARIPPERACIRCGQCVTHCPAGLVPIELYTDVLREDGARFVRHHGLDCIECGSCSYICPAKRRLAQAIRTVRRVELAKKAEAAKGRE
ncbi:MAG: electron transport complex subunit RsxC [Oscillospiraceae bacterium]|nr:electron transport complex subunit RsxC [Oscillospiraceae bacterium]